MNPGVDVAIIGGGLVGASLAVALAPLPLKVALIEAVAHDAPGQPSFDERTTALSNASRRIFDTQGLWTDIEPAASPIARIHISDRGHFGFARIEASRQGLAALGYVVPNRMLGRVLWSAIRARPQLEVHVPAKVRTVQRMEQGVRIDMDRADGGHSLCARLVVAADGAQSKVREALGVDASVRDYRQTALITTVLPQQFHGHTAYERFTPEGPLALLPMSEGRCTAVLTLSSERAQQAMQWDEGQYLAELQTRFGFRLGRFLKAGPRAAYPLALAQSHATSAERCIILGNAAQTLHPVAGMGFNLGLRDAACLAELLMQHGQADCGARDLLRAYDDWRASDRRGIIGFTDSLVRAFSHPSRPFGILRRAGLLAFDLLPPAKSALAGIASGTARSSRLARGVPLA